MAEIQNGSSAPEDYAQLTQTQVPLDDAVDAFATRDDSGRIPIVVVPQQLNRIRNELVGLALLILIGGIAVGILLDNATLYIPVAVGLAIILFVFGIYRSFMVRVPEGVNGLLARGGRYVRTLGSGTHVIPPWIVVSHLVTRREIPFDVPVLEVPTQDNVRANVDILITFSITEPYEFVYSISADDFDQVFQAICQDSLRAMVRQITSDEVINLTHYDMEGLRDVLGSAVEAYGIKVMKINVTYAQPPVDFMQSQEARKLAVLQQAEQAERQALAQRRQTDEEALARQQVVAQVEREREALQAQVQQAEARRRIVELEAEAEELRLAKLEERLAKYPHAATWEVEGLRLEIGRALAGNTRAILQVGSASDIVRTFLMRDNLQDKPVSPGDGSLAESQQQ
jgi:regulator of protease activity HflC (stomatin/prohibitin superfamily)